MRLTGSQMQQVAEALVAAFPTRADLVQMLLFQMNVNLNAIAGEGGLAKQVHELLVWAQAQGRVEELIAGAITAVPGNPLLKKLALDVESWKSGAPSPVPQGSDVNLTMLRAAMVDAFSAEDLQTLCADVEESLRNEGVDLPLNLETVGGASKPAQILNLIQYLQRRRQLPALVRAVRAARPGLV